MAALTRLVAAAPWQVDFSDGEGGDLVVSFASVGHDPGRTPSPEFVATATGRGTAAAPRRALFVSDDSRSWGNAPGFAEVLRQALALVSERAPVERVLTMGLSMGAVSALIAAQAVPVTAVLAFGPQWSVRADHMPDERRWSRWSDALPPAIWPVTPLPAPPARAVLFHGARDDLAQALAFPVAENVDHLIFPDLGHSDLVAHLKARGALAGLVESALAGDRRRLLRIAASAGGQRRARLFG